MDLTEDPGTMEADLTVGAGITAGMDITVGAGITAGVDIMEGVDITGTIDTMAVMDITGDAGGAPRHGHIIGALMATPTMATQHIIQAMPIVIVHTM